MYSAALAAPSGLPTPWVFNAGIDFIKVTRVAPGAALPLIQGMRASSLVLPVFAATVAAGLLLIPDATGVNVLPAIVAIALVMIGVERLTPGAPTPVTRLWYPRAIALNVCQVAVVITAGFTWNRWMRGASLLHSARWPDVFAVGLTYLISTFIFYWWHRWRHESAFWWRFAHQIHHSASRLEILTAFYKHPAEIAINSLLSAFLVYPVMGCSMRQGALYTVVIGLAEMFYHWNVRTPRWLGHWIQRPESHRIHHRLDRHTKNYGDLPLWDKLFGTFANPDRADSVVCGFSDEGEHHLVPMLLGADLHAPRASDPMKFNPVCFGCSRRTRCKRVKTPVFP